MNGKNLRIVGFVSSIIGFIITAFGVYKYEEAKGMVKALGQGSALFGSTDSTYRSEAIWLSIDEPSAGYIFTWDMLGNGQMLPILNYLGENGTHTEYIEGLMATDMKKTSDDLARFYKAAV